MAFLATKNFVASLQKRRNSSPLPMPNRIHMSSVFTERYQVIEVRRSKELPCGKNDGILRSPHSLSNSFSAEVTSFDTMCSLQQRKRRPTRLPPIQSTTAEKKEDKREVRRKKASFLKKSSKVHAQNTEKGIEVQATSKVQSHKSLRRKRQVKADGYKLLEEDEKIYEDKKGKAGKSFELEWEPNEDSEQDDEQKEVDLSDFQGKNNSDLIRKKSPSSGEDNIQISYRVKAKSDESPSGEITSSRASSVQKTEKPSEFKQMKLPIIASVKEHQIRRECESNGRTGHGSTDLTTNEFRRPLRRPRTSDPLLNNLQLQRNNPVLPVIKPKSSVQFPSLLQYEIRDGPPEYLTPRISRPEWDANKSPSQNGYNSVAAAERDSDLERERQRIRKLCRAQNELTRVSIEEDNYPACHGANQCFRASFLDVPDQNEAKRTRLPEIKPRKQSIHCFRRITSSTRVRPVSSYTAVPQRSTSAQLAYLTCGQSSVSQIRSCSTEPALASEKDTVRNHRESTQKLDVYEFLREGTDETNGSMERPFNSNTKSKDRKKEMSHIFRFLKRL